MNTDRFTQRHRIDERRVHVDLHDMEARPVRHGRAGKQYRPRALTLFYIQRDRSGWNLGSASLRGCVLRKDGSDSLVDTTEDFYGERDLPDWVQQIVAHFHPKADR